MLPVEYLTPAVEDRAVEGRCRSPIVVNTVHRRCRTCW
jgi:hypothetical protein